MRDKIGRDGIHPDDDQRDCPPAVLLHVDDPGERREEEETDPAAEERPARSPDALDDGANSSDMEKQGRGCEHCPGDQKALDGDPGSGRAKPFAGAEAKENGAHRGDKAEGEIAAFVVEEAGRARQNVEEPDVECLAKVAVLVPVGGEPCEVMVPVRWNSYGSVIETGPRSRIERPCQPIAEEEGAERGPLPTWTAMSKQEGERVSQADLGERVFKGKVRLRAACGTQEDPEGDEEEASPDGMRQLMTEALPILGAAVDGIRKRDADQKRESGLNGVVKTHACPFDVGLVEGKYAPEPAVGKGTGDFGEAHDFAHHEQHHKAAIGIDSNIARCRGCRDLASYWRMLDLMNIRGNCGLHSVPHRLVKMHFWERGVCRNLSDD